MERITISLKSELAKQFDDFIEEKGYSNRSEAMRDLIRDRLESERLQKQEDSACFAILTYVYNHRELDLPLRLAMAQHRNHDLTVSAMHVNLDHEDCLETLYLRGDARRVRAFADSIIAERGVRHGRVQLIPIDVESEDHSHVTPLHLHAHPRT